MTPATIAGASRVHTRDTIIQALRDYVELYGENFTTAAFNPATARWHDRPEDAERYEAGNPKTGEPWPSLNTIKAAFDGSWNAARAAAGFAPNKPGGRGKRLEGKHGPGQHVPPTRTRVVERVKVVRERVPGQVTTDLPTLRELRRELAAMERDRDRLAAALVKDNDRLSTARERARTHATAAAKQRERAERNATTVAELRAEVRDTAAALSAARVRGDELAERVPGLEQMVVELRLDLEATREELTRARETVELADPEELRRAADEVRDARSRVAASREAQTAAREAEALARAAQRQAESERDRALAQARSELTQRVAVQKAATGHDRRLTPAELDELRGKGPAGYSVFAEAVKAVAVARAHEPGKLREALRAAAGAAVRWSDRL